jgi:hypothetical protein
MPDDEKQRDSRDEPPAMDPLEILQENLRNRREEPIELQRTSSRKNRDYLILLIVGNLVLAGLFMLGSRNAVSVVFFVGALAVYNSSLTWVMLVVLSDY